MLSEINDSFTQRAKGGLRSRFGLVDPPMKIDLDWDAKIDPVEDAKYPFRKYLRDKELMKRIKEQRGWDS